MTKNWNNLQLKKLYFFGSKTTIYLSLGLHKGRPSYRSLQLSKENRKFLNFFYFWGFCLPKVIMKSHSRNQSFSYYFCLMTEGFGSGYRSVTRTKGSGSRRPENIQVPGISIRNTDINMMLFLLKPVSVARPRQKFLPFH
jgi:hypothetical protein